MKLAPSHLPYRQLHLLFSHGMIYSKSAILNIIEPKILIGRYIQYKNHINSVAFTRISIL